MPEALPNFDLTHGQLLWAVRYGREPDKHFKNQIRYLRLIDIPPASRAQAGGPGNRIRYDFFDLVEVGLAVTGLDLRFRPKDIAAVLVEPRDAMREIYAGTWRSIPEGATGESWVKSRGGMTPLMEDVYIRMHDRRGGTWGKVDLVTQQEANEALRQFEPVERIASEAPRPLLPLKRLMIQWVAWALDAPDIRPGRK